jgi:hypothetical protein
LGDIFESVSNPDPEHCKREKLKWVTVKKNTGKEGMAKKES